MKVARLPAKEHERRAQLHDKRQKAMGVPEYMWMQTLLVTGGPGKSGYKPEQRQHPGLRMKGDRP